MVSDKEIDKEQLWRDKEQKRMAEEQHKKVQPSDFDCEDCLGSDLNSAYERANKVKGM